MADSRNFVLVLFYFFIIDYIGSDRMYDTYIVKDNDTIDNGTIKGKINTYGGDIADLKGRLSNLENEYNAINDAFESFKFINKKKDENGEEIYYVDKNLMKNKIDFTKDVDKFLRAARKNGVKLPQEDVHLDKYNKDLRNLRRDFNNWFEKECK